MGSARLQLTESSASRVIIGRLLPGTELIDGIKKACLDNGLKCGVIVCGIGSLATTRFIYAKPCEQRKAGIKYSDPIVVNGPSELLTCQGMVGYAGNGEFSVHLHGIISDSNMKLYGGHFIDGCTVLVTVEITVLELADSYLLREFDEETEFSIFKFFSNKK